MGVVGLGQQNCSFLGISVSTSSGDQVPFQHGPSGMRQEYLFILPPSLLKSFLPSEEGPQGNTMIRADFSPAPRSWDPVGTTTAILWDPHPARYPQPSRGASLDGWWPFPVTWPSPCVLIQVYFTFLKYPTLEIV